MERIDKKAEDLTSDYFAILRQSLRRASVGITPILVNNWRPKWESVGTAFVVTYRGKVYLVTAKHVLACAHKNRQVAAHLFGRQVFLHGLYYADSDQCDLAVTLLPFKWLESYGITEIYAPQLDSLPSIYQPTGEFELVGYPASKNKWDLRWPNDISMKIFTISAELDDRKLNLSKILGAIHVHYDHKAYGPPLPALQGMSGGPLFEVMSRKVGDKNGLSLTVRGVLCEWHKPQRVVVAGSISSVIDLIENHSFMWEIAADSHARPALSIWTPPKPMKHYLPIDRSPPPHLGDK